MSSYIRIAIGRPLSIFTEDGRLIPGCQAIIIPFDDDDSAMAASREVTVRALGGLPPGFAHVATHVIQGEVVNDDTQKVREITREGPEGVSRAG